MATFLAVPLKKTYEVDLVKPLRQFIANTYTNAKPDEYETALQEFNKLRNQVLSKSADKHESALEVLFRYYDQLEAIESKFPITENSIRINFKWQDCFDKETFFSGKRTLTIASGAYEKVCVLFNIGALESQIAECQNHTSDEGLKKSAKLFMQASSVFNHLKDNILSHVQGDPTPDLHPDTLGAIAALLLAQAQDCFCRKAINDKMKPAIIAKLCAQAGSLYGEANNLLQLDTLRNLWPKDWIPGAYSIEHAYRALAEYYQGLHHKESKEFGQQIARMKKAKDLMQKTEGKMEVQSFISQHSKVISRDLEEAVKDNNFIYHAKIPDANSLPAIGKQSIAKQSPVTPPFSSDFKDVFDKVVPLAVHQAMGAFENRKAEIINWEIGRMREATQTMNGILASLNLPASIEDLSGTKVPPSLLEKSAKVKEMGGIQLVKKLMSDLPQLLKRNREILEETMQMLTEEGTSDDSLRQQFKERWTRTPSSKLTATIFEEGRKYQQIIDNAVNADKIVQGKYNTHEKYIDTLSRPDSELVKALPSGGGAAGLQGSPVIEELRSLMNQVEAIKNERDVIEHEIKDSKFDMSSKFLMALKADGALDEPGLSQQELDRVYAPLREQVNSSIKRQEGLLAQIQEANNKFTAAKSGESGAAARDQALRDAQAAFDTFVELKSNLEEGTKFYNDLTNLLVKFQTKVADFCFARKTEKDELLKDLTTSISRQNSAPPPAAPAYQQPEESRRQPPARPPPPNVGNAPPRQAPGPGGAAPPPPQGSAPPAPQGSAPPYPMAGAYGAGMPMPYPMYPAQGYAPMPQGYNPYAANPYGYPPQMPPQQPPYPGAPPPGGYPQWR